jgi:hypothetical protein
MSDGSFTTFDVPGATSFGTGGINASGQIVGNYTDASGTHGYLLSGIGGSFTTFDVPGAASTFVNGINDSGQILGSYDAGGTRHGFVLSEGIYTTIEVPGANLTSTHGINNFGQVVGTYSDAGGMLHGFVATPMPAFRITAAPTAVAGTPFDVTVTALEAYGKIDTTYQGTVTFTTTDPDSGVVLPADYTFTTGDGGDNGVHTFPGGVTLATVGDQTLSGTDTVSGAVGSASVTVGPGP